MKRLIFLIFGLAIILSSCNSISKKPVTEKLTTVEEVQDVIDAGLGCGSCIDDIEDILKDYLLIDNLLK